MEQSNNTNNNNINNININEEERDIDNNDIEQGEKINEKGDEKMKIYDQDKQEEHDGKFENFYNDPSKNTKNNVWKEDNSTEKDNALNLMSKKVVEISISHKRQEPKLKQKDEKENYLTKPQWQASGSFYITSNNSNNNDIKMEQENENDNKNNKPINNEKNNNKKINNKEDNNNAVTETNEDNNIPENRNNQLENQHLFEAYNHSKYDEDVNFQAIQELSQNHNTPQISFLESLDNPG